MRHYYIPTRITIARKRQTIPTTGDVEKTESSNIVRIENGTETWKTFWQFIKLLNKNFSYSLEITHLRTYPREKKTYVHTKTYINPKWKYPRCFSMQWIKILGDVDKMEYCLAI